MRSIKEWNALSEALAFVGNSLLAPMNQTSDVGLDPAFWDAFPDFGSEGVAKAIAACDEYALKAQIAREAGEDPTTQASVEYTKLFIGPPSPSAAPWESTYLEGANSRVGFGPAALQMRELLRKAGLELAGSNNQYADHIGIELLLASVLASRVADAGEETRELATEYVGYCEKHPLSWIGRLQAAVQVAAPSGYYTNLLALAAALLALN